MSDIICDSLTVIYIICLISYITLQIKWYRGRIKFRDRTPDND